MIKVTPLSIGGDSGSATYIRVDGAGKLTHMQKREIEFRVNNHDRLTEENAKLREALELITSTSGWKATTKINDIARIYELLNQLKDQNNDK